MGGNWQSSSWVRAWLSLGACGWVGGRLYAAAAENRILPLHSTLYYIVPLFTRSPAFCVQAQLMKYLNTVSSNRRVGEGWAAQLEVP